MLAGTSPGAIQFQLDRLLGYSHFSHVDIGPGLGLGCGLFSRLNLKVTL